MDKKKVIAIDLGASSGRVISVAMEDGKLEFEEVHRFANEGVHAGGRFYTDILYIYREIIAGLKEAVHRSGSIESVAIDSWGVDFALLDAEGELMCNPYHYRDEQAVGMIEEADKIFGKRGLFCLTGVQDMWYNSVYQIQGLQRRKPDFLERAECFLMIPDILGYFLTGNRSIEYSSASTTQMYDLQQKTWSENICRKLGLDLKILPEVVMTGAFKGNFSPKIKRMIGLPDEKEIRLTAAAGHDSASAAYAVPAKEKNYIFISSGTWSVIGKLLEEPLITNEIYDKGYSNEGAAFGKIKLVKSIMGMWLIQELRKCWKNQGKKIDYGYLTEESEKADAFSHMINVDDELFVAPLDMELAINQYCIRTQQTVMEKQGQFYRAVMESLAFKYREAIQDLENIVGETVDTIYLLGGAVQDRAFCRYIANATGKRVSAGPIEATAIGNAMIQMKALGYLENGDEYIRMIRESFDICCYEPEETEVWNRMYERYREVTAQ